MPGVVATYNNSSLMEKAAYASSLAGAGSLVPAGLMEAGKPSPGKILLVMETGAMLGIAPMAAIQGITVIEGRATISPQLMSGLIRKSGHGIRIVRTGTIEEGTFSVTVFGKRSDTGEEYSDTWDVARAIRAGLVNGYTQNQQTKKFTVDAKKDNWKKYPENMCTWRAVGNVGRMLFDDVLMGVTYTPEEMEASVDGEGTILGVDADRENDEISAFTKLDDKNDMRSVWGRLHRENFWSPRIAAEFAAHLGTLTKDSAPKQGAPGNTGDTNVDERTGEVVEDAEVVDDDLSAPEPADVHTPAPAAEPATVGLPDGTGGALFDTEEPPADLDAEQRAWEAAEVAAYEAERAAG